MGTDPGDPRVHSCPALDWPEPKNKREVQSFLGFVNFYRRFVKNFSHHARPLFDLTRKEQKWKWDSSEASAFRKLKELVTSAPVLITPADNQPFRIEADSSDFATGAVYLRFQRKTENGIQWPFCQNHSQRPSGIMRFTTRRCWQLCELWTSGDTSWREHHTRWRSGLTTKSMGKSDALSQWADHSSGSDDNRDITLLTPKFFAVRALEGVHLEGQERELLKLI